MSGNDPKLWGGRFRAATRTDVERFTASVHIDRRLADADIRGSIAHARMLARVGVISVQESERIIAGLTGLRAEIEGGRLEWSEALEDVHMTIEARLTERIGEAGKKLHTGRSRNDQVVTDVRLWLRDTIDQLRVSLAGLAGVMIDVAEREADTVMPGFTHLQVAQPVTFGHHLLAWVEMLQRDRERLADCRRRVNVLPLGSAALAGTSFPLDRASVARELGFDDITRNSLDAVSDRDFAIEFVAAAALCMVHLSRMAEELILWMSDAYRFIDLPDEFCTGSSIMPQKKNPDVAELVRGRSARVCGHLAALLMLMKAQPLAYNRDNQEDKEPLFDSADTLAGCLAMLAAMIPEMKVNRARMREAAGRGFATATDLAEYLVRRGVPFRDAHEAVGRVVAHALAAGRELADLSLAELQAYAPATEADAREVLDLDGSVRARAVPGGTAPQRVRDAAAAARARLADGD